MGSAPAAHERAYAHGFAVSHTPRLLIFTRYPRPGQVKTRLIPALGAEGAARLHRRMAEHVVSVGRGLMADNGVRISVCFSEGAKRDCRAWLGTDLHYLRQPDGDLGARLSGAVIAAFRAGAAPVLAVGSDLPGLTPEILRGAVEALQHSDVVLGPASDGGYYLLGMREPRPELFADIQWGSAIVAEQTLAAARRLGASVAQLPALDDVDRPEDLHALRDDPRFSGVITGKERFSVIIPCLDEETILGRTLDHLQQEQVEEGDLEIIVVDGGSTDNTPTVAAEAGAAVMETTGGKAAQQNLGARAARGRELLFLHADTLPPRGFAGMIRKALDDPAVVAGAFRLRIDGPGAGMRLVEQVAYFPLLRHSYWRPGPVPGEKGVRRDGRLSRLAIMEDFQLVRGLRRRGRIVTLPEEVLTSARRWSRLGILRTTLINQVMVLGFLCGFPAHVLARLYRGGRKR